MSLNLSEEVDSMSIPKQIIKYFEKTHLPFKEHHHYYTETALAGANRVDCRLFESG